MNEAGPIDPRYAALNAAFVAVRERPPSERALALARIDDPELRADVAELLKYDDGRPLVRDTTLAEPADSVDGRPPPPIIGARLDGRYEVHWFVADGGFGWVFRGHDEALDAAVAVKVFKPIADARAARTIRAAFDREADVLAGLAAEIPNIVGYRDVGEWLDDEGETYPYLVLEWLEGRTLREYARETAPDGMSLAEAMALLEPVAEALAMAHTRGLAHRDIKPGNIVRVERDGVATLTLVDFGAVKLAADRARGFDSTGGEPGMISYRYSAPEQLDRSLGATGPWSDVYGLAVVFVELMLGSHPWRDAGLLDIIHAATDPGRRPTPATLGLAVPPTVEAVFAQALAVDHGDRPRDVGAFWTALRAATTAGAAVEAGEARRGWLARLFGR